MTHSQKQSDFVGKLKHGKCEGRGQLPMRSGIQPDYCVNKNAGVELHDCPHEGFWMHGECNCCKECESICVQAEIIRRQQTEKMTIDKLYDKWKDYIKGE